MPEHDLTLRRTVIGGDRIENDFTVWYDKRSVGRIKFAASKMGQEPGWAWFINVPLPIPAWANGAAVSLEAAKAQFRAAWERFYAGLTPARIERWHQIADAAAKRSAD